MKHGKRGLSSSFLTWLPGLAILLGASIYLFVRPAEPFVFRLGRRLGLDSLMRLVRPDEPLIKAALPDFLVYSVPNALWAFAYALVIVRIWSPVRHWTGYFWLSTIPLLVLGFEILQFPGILPGTFSYPDLFWGILGSAGGILLGIKSRKHTSYESEFN